MNRAIIFILFFMLCISCEDTPGDFLLEEQKDDTVNGSDDKIDYTDPTGNWFWQDKHILWLGTSIPAGGGDSLSYPAYTAQKLGAVIHNEAVGSSMIRAFDYKGSWVRVAWTNLSRALSHTITEKEMLINYFNSGLDKNGKITSGGKYGWKDLCIGAPQYLSEKDKKFIISCSYEEKLIHKYLDSNSPEFIIKPDVIVIDHGYNDLTQDWYEDNEINSITVPVDKYDRRRFIGATNFIVNVIKSYYPDQKIVFIGHYESDRKKRIYKAQLNLFEYWKSDYPSFKLWEVLGWSQEIDPSTGKTITQLNMPDDLHPDSDTRIDKETGFKVAIKQIGECCYNFFKDLY